MFLWHKDTFLWHKDTFSWQKVFFLWHKLFSNYLQYVTNQLPLRLLIVLKLTNKTSETPHKTLKDQWRLLSICFLKKFFLQKLLIWAFFYLLWKDLGLGTFVWRFCEAGDARQTKTLEPLEQKNTVCLFLFR